MPRVHDLNAFNPLSVGEQERVIDRAKATASSLSAAEEPPTSHLARAETSVDGRELELFRRSVPYGGAEEHVLELVAFSGALAP